MASLQIDENVLDGNPNFIARLDDTYHQCGGMRMATSQDMGVVDSDCRVWGTNNIFVAGACVFPTSSHANCTLTALALTARLSEAIKAIR